uniref:Uncharacterized protein n=1 Tax=Lepeophtheirus salmonis TaxID=72036 RepID=A0A0K2UMB1_LEPSM
MHLHLSKLIFRQMFQMVLRRNVHCPKSKLGDLFFVQIYCGKNVLGQLSSHKFFSIKYGFRSLFISIVCLF